MSQLVVFSSIKHQIKLISFWKIKSYSSSTGLKIKKPNHLLKKPVAFADEGSSNSNTDRIMARMDAMTLKMDAQYKELQTHAKKTKPDLDEDDILMSREEEAKFMQTFRKTRFYNDYRDHDSNRDNWRSNERSSYNRDNYRSNTDDKPYDHKKQFNDFKKSQQSTNAFIKETFMDLKTQLKTVAKNHQASIQNLETKFDRLADKQSGRPSGSLPSNTQPNPKGHNSKAYQPPQSRNEHVNAVFTRSGKSYNPPVNSNDQQTNSENPINFDDSDEEDEEPTSQPKIQNLKPVKETTLPKPYKPKISYPQRLRKEKMEAQYGKFLDVIRAVRINVSLIDVLAVMPNYWPTIIKEAHTLVRLCEACQKTGNISKRVTVDYVSKWAEAQALPTNDARVVVTFLKKLFCHFGMPKALISDRGTHFCNKIMEKTMKRYGVNHRFSTSYHPQTSGQVENTNRALKRILEKTVKDNPAIWSRKLDDALWAFRTAYKTPTGTTPYKLIYGKNCHLPFEIEHRAYWALKNCNPDLIDAERSAQDVLKIIENKSKVRNSRNKLIISQVKTSNVDSSEIASVVASVVTSAMTAMFKQHQVTPAPASVKAVEESCVTCGGAHSYRQCPATDDNTFSGYHDNIQGYVSAATVNYNQGNTGYRPPITTLSELEKFKKTNKASMQAMRNHIGNLKLELRNEMQATMSNQTNELKNMMASFFQMNTASSSGSGSLPSNTIANPKGELKAITTQSRIVLDGPSVPIPPQFINPEEDERAEETLTDPELVEYTIKVPPPLV
ncbi:reverse transcriptase domain-containing protein [Tanacetum coccineum]